MGTVKIQYIEIDLNHEVQQEVLQIPQLAITAHFERSFRKPCLSLFMRVPCSLGDVYSSLKSLGIFSTCSRAALGRSAAEAGLAPYWITKAFQPHSHPQKWSGSLKKLKPLYFISPLTIPRPPHSAWLGSAMGTCRFAILLLIIHAR